MIINVPVFRHSIYAYIVISSLIIGCLSACLMIRKSGAKKETALYTALLTFVAIILCSLSLSLIIYGDIRKMGFVGAGGALGVLVGSVISCFIHRDHSMELIGAFICCAPLMYGLSKLACHFSGCCYGIEKDAPVLVMYTGGDYIEAPMNIGLFPVQLAETVAFLTIFVIGYFLFLKPDTRHISAIVTVILCVIAKCTLDIFRASHIPGKISGNQALAVSVGVIAIVLITISNKVFTENSNGQ